MWRWIVAGVVLLALSEISQSAQTQSPTTYALAGQVTSKAEGAMEGVLITAQRNGSTFTTTVVSNAQGQFGFPRNRLEPGTYAVTVRALGFHLSDRTSVTVPARGAANLHLTLDRVTDKHTLGSQLTSVEWFQSMPGSAELKDSFWRRSVNCAFCHPLEKVVRTTYTAEQWIPVIRRMASYAPDNTSGWGVGRVQRNPGPIPDSWSGMPYEKMAELLAAGNLSGGKAAWDYEFKTLPRPKGRATRAVVTVYPIPRQPSVLHDISVDSKGNVWYGNSGWEYIGKFDPRSGRFSEWALPPRKTDILGVHDIQVDPDDNLWAAFRTGTAKFDSAKEQWTVYDQGPGLTCQHGGFIPQPRRALDTMWTGGRLTLGDGQSVTALCRFNYKTGKAEAFPLFEGGPPGRHIPYQIERDSKDVAYALDFGAPWEAPNQSHYVVRLDPNTKATTWFPTPTPKSFPRRGGMDDQDRYWFAEFYADNIAVFDTRTETFQEYPVGIKYLAPYFTQPDRNGEVWVSNFSSDRLIRFNPRTREMTHYLMPEYYDSRKVVVDYSTGRLVVWLGSENTAHLIRIEPLD